MTSRCPPKRQGPLKPAVAAHACRKHAAQENHFIQCWRAQLKPREFTFEGLGLDGADDEWFDLEGPHHFRERVHGWQAVLAMLRHWAWRLNQEATRDKTWRGRARWEEGDPKAGHWRLVWVKDQPGRFDVDYFAEIYRVALAPGQQLGEHFPGRKGSGQRFSACVQTMLARGIQPKVPGATPTQAARRLCAWIGRRAGRI